MLLEKLSEYSKAVAAFVTTVVVGVGSEVVWTDGLEGKEWVVVVGAFVVGLATALSPRNAQPVR